MREATENKQKIIAAVATLLLHALLFFLFYLYVIKTPIPAFPEAGSPGIEIDFGNLIEGTGNTEDDNIGNTAFNESNTAKVEKDNTPVNTSENPVITNEAEESISLKNDKKNNKPKSEKVPEKKQEDPKPSDELSEALNLFKQKKYGTSGGDGNSGNAGNAGDPNGVPNGGGDGGNGGNGGKGFGYDLRGRSMVKRPQLMDDSQEEGKVVVEIIVDENGRVIKAVAGARGTTTTSSVLWSKARQAALSTRFNNHNDGVKEQRGTITFVFILN